MRSAPGGSQWSVSSTDKSGVQHRSQLDLKHFQDLHQYVDSLFYTCENQTASGTWLVHGQARLVRHSMFQNLQMSLCHLMSLSDLLRSFTTSGDFEGAVETNTWDALQPSIVTMTSRHGSVSQLVAACGELTIPMTRVLTKRSVRN